MPVSYASFILIDIETGLPSNYDFAALFRGLQTLIFKTKQTCEQD